MIPDIEDIGEQLRAKITSKFTASTFLAGFALTIFTGQVFALWQSSALSTFFPISAGAVAGAIHLFIQAIMRLDELTMPKLFWDDSPALRSQAQLPVDAFLQYHNLWSLRDQMIFFWYRLTITATLITAVAVVLMLVPSPLMCVRSFPVPTLRIWTLIAVLVCWALAAAYCLLVSRHAEKKFERLKHD